MTDVELSPAEKKALLRLKRLAAEWPDTLWLFAADGNLHVMRMGKDSNHAITPYGGMDPDYSIAVIKVDTDGGDW